MEYVGGGDLSLRLRDGGLPLEQLREYTQQLVEALAYLHGKHVVHKDLRVSFILTIVNWGDWLGNLAVKTMALQFMLEGPRPCTILCFNSVHTTVEYLNKNVSIGQLLQHIPNSIVVCAGSRPKRQTKTFKKDVCQVS